MTRSVRVRLVALLGALGMLSLAASAIGTAGGAPETTYRVTIRNLASGQPLSPPVAATHRKAIRMFTVGRLATDELAAIAQDGNEVPMFELFSSSPHVTQAVDVGRPLTRMGTTVGSFTDSATFEIAAAPGDRLSLATMLICTNDGILGLDAVKLPDETATFLVNGYDAGREQNTEQSVDLVDPCSALGPAPLPGDPDGNRNDEVATVPAEVIAHHPGISGTGELGAAHAWTDPVAEITVERVS
jgi:hypothetical protein